MGLTKRTGLKDEARGALHPGQNRGGCVKKCTVTEVAVRFGHNGGTWRLSGSEDANQPPAFGELLKEPLRRDFCGTIKHDDVIGGVCRSAFHWRASLHGNIRKAELT